MMVPRRAGQCQVALLLAAVTWLSGCAQKSPKALDNDAVHAVFLDFKQAVAAGDADAAVQLVSQRTINHYQRLRDAALTGSVESVRSLSLPLQFEVLTLRDRMTAEELHPHDGRSLATAYLSRGWINTGLLSRLKLGNVIHKGEYAEARVAEGEALLPQRLAFYREDNTWKFDLAAAIVFEKDQYESKMEREKLTPDELLDQLLKASVQRRPVESLWEPLIGEPGSNEGDEVALAP
jgi:hypothetical protein